MNIVSRSLFNCNINNMIKNYFTTTIAHIIRNNTHSLISILSQTIGLAECVLLLFYIQSELSFIRLICCKVN